MELPDISKIKKYSRVLNKLGLHEHKIDLKEKDHKELLRAFMLSMQRIGDLSLDSQIDEEIFNFYDQECLSYAENQGNDTEESGEFDRDEVESELYDYDFEEIENYIAENEIEISTALDSDTFGDNQDDIIAEILDFMEAREAGKEVDAPHENECICAEAEAKSKLMDLDFKALKNHIKDNPELKKKFGIIKMADYKSKREAIINEIIDIEFGASAALEGENKSDDIASGLHEKLYKMDYKSVKAFLKENELKIKIILRNWTNPDEKEKIILEIVEKLSPVNEVYDRDTEQEKLESLTCEELQAYAEKNGLIDEITDIDPETFDDEQEDLIDQILDVLDYREEEKSKSKPDPKPDSSKKKESPKPATESTSKRGKKPSTEYSVDGDTNHHCISRAIRDYKGEFSKVEISKIAEADREKLGKSSGSVSSFVNIIITSFFVAGVLTPGKKEGYFTFKK